MSNKSRRYDIIMVSIILISLLGTVLIYNKVPDKVPSNWNIRGETDGFQNKLFIFITASIPFLIYGFCKLLPKIDPKRKTFIKHKKAYQLVISSTIIFLILIHWVTIFYSLGYHINVVAFIQIIIGMMFLVMGNYMPQIRHNYFLGIRTPWTLSNETVWKKTHMIGGYIFFVLGMLFIIGSFLPSEISFYITMGAMVICILGLIIYSFIVFKNLQENKE